MKEKKSSPKVAPPKKASTKKTPRAKAQKVSQQKTSFYSLCVHCMNKHISPYFRKKTKKKPRGFTLIELMIVMAIITIMATIGISSYMSYIKKANDTTTIGLMRQMNTIIASLINNKGIPPTQSELNAYLQAEGLVIHSTTLSPLAYTEKLLQNTFGVPHIMADTIALKNFPKGICADGNECVLGYVVFLDSNNSPTYYGIFANFRSEKTPPTEAGFHTINVPGVGNIRASFISNHPTITPTLSDNNGTTEISTVSAITNLTPSISVIPLTTITGMSVPLTTISSSLTDSNTETTTDNWWETTTEWNTETTTYWNEWESTTSAGGVCGSYYGNYDYGYCYNGYYSGNISDNSWLCTAYAGYSETCYGNASTTTEWMPETTENWWGTTTEWNTDSTTTYCPSGLWDWGYDYWGNWVYDCVDFLIPSTTYTPTTSG